MKRIPITLPIPPSQNLCYINKPYGRGGRGRILSPAGRNWKENTVVSFLKILADSGMDSREVAEEMKRGVALNYCFYFPSLVYPDRDNCFKLTQDAISEALGIRDKDFHSRAIRTVIGDYEDGYMAIKIVWNIPIVKDIRRRIKK